MNLLDNQAVIKHRELRFCQLRPDNQATDAALLLNGIEGMHRAHPESPTHLKISYDIRYITLEAIEELLTELEFHLSSRLICTLKRALYRYTEETERLNLGLERHCKDCSRAYLNRYRETGSGCRDERPEHWRTYL